MKIEINYNNANYLIYVEPSCFSVFKLGVSGKTGLPTEANVGYFANLSNACRKIIQNENSETDETISLKEYCLRIENAYAELLRQTDV